VYYGRVEYITVQCSVVHWRVVQHSRSQGAGKGREQRGRGGSKRAPEARGLQLPPQCTCHASSKGATSAPETPHPQQPGPASLDVPPQRTTGAPEIPHTAAGPARTLDVPAQRTVGAPETPHTAARPLIPRTFPTACRAQIRRPPTAVPSCTGQEHPLRGRVDLPPHRGAHRGHTRGHAQAQRIRGVHGTQTPGHRGPHV